MALGSNVKKFREAAGLTQTQLAEMAGMDQQALAALEKRDSKASQFTAALAKALRKSVYELLGMEADLTGASDAAPERDDYINPDEMIELLALYQQATRRGRENIMDLARSAAKRSRIRWSKVADNEA